MQGKKVLKSTFPTRIKIEMGENYQLGKMYVSLVKSNSFI